MKQRESCKKWYENNKEHKLRVAQELRKKYIQEGRCPICGSMKDEGVLTLNCTRCCQKETLPKPLKGSYRYGDYIQDSSSQL